MTALCPVAGSMECCCRTFQHGSAILTRISALLAAQCDSRKFQAQPAPHGKHAIDLDLYRLMTPQIGAPTRCFCSRSASPSARILPTHLIMLSRSSARTALPRLRALVQQCLQSLTAASGSPDEWVSKGEDNIGCYSRTEIVADAVA